MRANPPGKEEAQRCEQQSEKHGCGRVCWQVTQQAQYYLS